ncbi:hypothetical protein I4U23_022565 [Adineta vaga]|nr:hypothetical protein I4U23_022565 [Adineta vaga]
MHHIKRSLEFNETSDIESNKLKKTSHEEKSRITLLENLSNDLFYEIFDYLDGYNISQAFSKLNIRFQHLITSSTVLLKIKVNSKIQSEVDDLCQNVILPNRQHIISLYFENALFINDHFTKYILDSSFNHLESITLKKISLDRLIILLLYLNSLPRLFSLSIELNDTSIDNLTDVYRLIFSLPFLKSNTLSILTFGDNIQYNIFIPFTIQHQFSAIEYLSLNHNCTIDELLSILHYTPRLRYLTCRYLTKTDSIIDIKPIVKLFNLTYLCICDCQLNFDEFEIFIVIISSHLKVLKILEYKDEHYLDGNRWERIIKNQLPQLRKFYFKHKTKFHTGATNAFLLMNINKFTSIFWIERQWFVEVNVFGRFIDYLINPYRQSDNLSPKYVMKMNEEMIDQCSMSFITPTKLRILRISKGQRTQVFIANLKSLSAALQFTCLNIRCKEISTEILMKIIDLLPNLDSLDMTLPYIESISPFNYNENIDFSTSINNRITKVTLKRIHDIKEVNFFLNLCLRMKYLHLSVLQHINLDDLLRCILLQANTFLSQLKYVCLHVPSASEEIVYQLQKLIDTEKLLTNYMINRSGNYIYLKWK